MYTLKQVEELTGIKTDNLRQRIHRKTLGAIKQGRDWFIDEETLLILQRGENVIKRTNQSTDRRAA